MARRARPRLDRLPRVLKSGPSIPAWRRHSSVTMVPTAILAVEAHVADGCSVVGRLNVQPNSRREPRQTRDGTPRRRRPQHLLASFARISSAGGGKPRCLLVPVPCTLCEGLLEITAPALPRKNNDFLELTRETCGGENGANFSKLRRSHQIKHPNRNEFKRPAPWSAFSCVLRELKGGRCRGMKKVFRNSCCCFFLPFYKYTDGYGI